MNALHRTFPGFSHSARPAAAGAVLIVLSGGCAPVVEPAPDPELPMLRARVEALETELADAHTAHSNQLSQLTALTVTLKKEHEDRYLDMESTLRRQVYDLTQTIQSLREDLAAATQSAAPPPPEARPDQTPPPETDPVPAVARPAFSEYRPAAPDLSDFIERPTGPNPDLFPVAILEVEGKVAVVGTHLSTRQVETGETRTDGFGKEVPILKQERYEVEDYAYRVSFRARNRTRTPRTLTFRCGQESGTLDLPPGAEKTGTVGALRGAPLQVTVGAAVRSFPVPSVSSTP